MQADLVHAPPSDAAIWACGFVAGMQPCEGDGAALLATAQGRAWLHPIQLLGEDDFDPEQDALSRTPTAREILSLAMHQHWLPQRRAGHERQAAERSHC